MNITTITTLQSLDSPSRLDQIILDVMSRSPLSFQTGINPIDGENIFVNRISADTKTYSDSLSEIHQSYIDVHIVLTGHEGYAAPITPAASAEIADYNSENDAALCCTIENEQHFKLAKDQCVTFFPGEWHRPMLADGEPNKVDKIVIKVKADLL
ncbi:YhcH/YjgK/YiaL family protein [Photobacterium minamisatsumaniensis]|uniref:YhcH/YjgK/YiaL family protein n=1 Tax=Photobacterium minamisatsumaniensis TaxID=2910233 RepID=UPI003D0E0F3D